MTPIDRAYRDCWEVQDACNFLAVANAFARDVKAVYDSGEVNDNSRGLAQHPVCVLYLDKLCDMAGRLETDVLSNAIDTIRKRQLKCVGLPT